MTNLIMHIPSSKRLDYALMSADDAELLFQLDQDPEVMRYINGGTCTSRADIQQMFIPRMNSYLNPQEGWGLWKVSLIATKQFIGWILVRPMEFFSPSPEFDNLELGWRFMQST
jgi:RimJ/RimL family protein N-acetyltransferase